MNDTLQMMTRLITLKTKGYCCAQIIMILTLEAQGKTNLDLVRSMAGLCFGTAGSGEVCGALSGGACLIALYTGKGSDEETPDTRYSMMAAELTDWFRSAADSEYGGMRCDQILGRFPDRSICGQIVADTYGKCMDILASHGFDPAAVKNG